MSKGLDGLPRCLSGKKSACSSRNQETWIISLGREDPLVEELTPTPVFLPGEFHGISKSRMTE